MVLQVLISLLLWQVPSPDSLLLVFWNLENFFDWQDGAASESDHQWSAAGERHWTRRRFLAKCHSVSKSIAWIGDKTGRMPDIVAVAEIENRKVLAQLLTHTPLRKMDYAIVHYDSPDRRGIDVALLYRKSVFRLARSVPLPVPGLQTRDILLASLVAPGGDTLHLLVNHHPSKYGGPVSAVRREAAIGRLRAICDSLWDRGGQNMVLCGDFNDTPENALFERLSHPPSERPAFYNHALPLSRRGSGTIRFNGSWEMIDLFFTAPALTEKARMEICRIPFLMVWDNVHPGYKPLRTYSGPRYLGGVSDHCPVLLHLASGPY